MVPRETYDPEDIESLLSERSFDELLAEERAFVLRHLSGREEYEHMRRLLHQVRADERGPRDLLEPEDAVREHVLQVFRDRQQPAWRIWLNSVQAFLVPERAAAAWRPALALAAVALLLTGAVVVYQRLSNANEAQVAVVETKEPAMPQPGRSAQQPPPGPASDPAKSAAAGTQRTVASTTEGAAERAPSAAFDARTGLEALQKTLTGSTAMDEAVVVAKETEVQEEAALGTAANTDSAFKDMAAATAPATLYNYVVREDLDRNGTLTNAAGEVAKQEMVLAEVRRSHKSPASAVEKSLDDDSRSLAQDGQLLDLLNAAW